MELKMVSLVDKKSGIQLPPDFLRSHVDAIRSFEKMVNTPEYKYNTHPEDFYIHEVGTYDDETGTFVIHNPPHTIASGVDVWKPKQ